MNILCSFPLHARSAKRPIQQYYTCAEIPYRCSLASCSIWHFPILWSPKLWPLKNVDVVIQSCSYNEAWQQASPHPEPLNDLPLTRTRRQKARPIQPIRRGWAPVWWKMLQLPRLVAMITVRAMMNKGTCRASTRVPSHLPDPLWKDEVFTKHLTTLELDVHTASNDVVSKNSDSKAMTMTGISRCFAKTGREIPCVDCFDPKAVHVQWNLSARGCNFCEKYRKNLRLSPHVKKQIHAVNSMSEILTSINPLLDIVTFAWQPRLLCCTVPFLRRLAAVLGRACLLCWAVTAAAGGNTWRATKVLQPARALQSLGHCS